MSVNLIHEGLVLEMDVTSRSYILVVLSVDPEKWVKSWRCAIIHNELGGDEPGDVVSFEETVLRRNFKRIT